jgi:competence protein ComEC
MVLAAGVVFWLVRALLALVPGLALAWPIKKIAGKAAIFLIGQASARPGTRASSARTSQNTTPAASTRAGTSRPSARSS